MLFFNRPAESPQSPRGCADGEGSVERTHADRAPRLYQLDRRSQTTGDTEAQDRESLRDACRRKATSLTSALNGARMSPKQAELLLAAIAIVVGIYVLAVRQFARDAELQLHTFGTGTPPADRLEVSAQIMSVSPVKDSLRVRFGFKPFGKYAADQFGRFAHDMTAVVATTDGYRTVRLAAGETAVAINKDIDLADGSPHDYPFDRYTARIGISAFARSNGAGGSSAVAAVVKYEEHLGNYAITASRGSEHARVRRRIAVERRDALCAARGAQLITGQSAAREPVRLLHLHVGGIRRGSLHRPDGNGTSGVVLRRV